MSHGDDTPWVRIAVEIPAAAEEHFLAVAGPLAASGVDVLGDAARPVHPELAEMPPHWVHMGFYAPAAESRELHAELVNLLKKSQAEGEVSPAARVLAPTDVSPGWEDRWREFFHVSRVSERLTIRPTWEHHMPSPGERVLDLDPGRAFGTGGHATTRLCLRALDKHGAGTEVLDVGTGSGVLAIAAARLGARRVVAIDVDEEAVKTARENVGINAVGDLVALSSAGLDTIESEHDRVIANIISSVLRTLRDALAKRVAPGGLLLVSGVLREEREAMTRCFEETGLRCLDWEAEEGWVGIVFEKERT